MIQSSSSGRVKLNRTILSKDSNALPKKRRSFGGTNPDRAVTEPTPDNLTLNAGVRKTAPESIEDKTNGLELSSINIPDEGDGNLELSSINIPDEGDGNLELSCINIQIGKQIFPSCSQLNPENASHPTSTKVELQQAPEEDKDSPNQAEGLRKGTEKPLDTNLPYELRRRGAGPGQNISPFGNMYERAGGPNTRSKTSSGKTSFKACQLEKMKSERVKRHGKQVCCRLAFALRLFGEDSDKIRVSKKDHSAQNRSKCKAENVFVGSGNRDGRKEKRREGKALLVSAQHTQPIKGTCVKAKKRQSKRLIFQRKRYTNVYSDATACMNTTPHRTASLVADGSSQPWAVTKRRETVSTTKKEKHIRSLAVCQQTREGWYNGKIAQVRSSRHVVGTAKKDAKSSHCMALRRRKSGGITENWIYKVPGKKPNTEGSAVFHPYSLQILQDQSGEDNDRRLIKGPCCTTCCELKYAPPRIYSFAKVRPNKPCKIPGKNPIEQRFKKWDPDVENNPFVNLCDILKSSKVLADQLDSMYVLNEELKRKPIKCFKRNCGDLIHLDIQDGPCTSAEASQSEEVTNHCVAHMIDQSVEDTAKVVDGPFPVVNLTESVDSQSLAIGSQPEKRMRLSTERLGDTAHVSEILKEPNAAIQMACSSTASASQEERPSSDALLLCSTGPAHKSENHMHNDGVQGNQSPVVSHMVMMGTEESRLSGESCIDSCVDGEMEDENKSQGFSSCQRTTPSQVSTRPSCARVYISWPFRERLSYTNGWDVSVTSQSVSGPSLVALSVSPLCDSSITDTPISQNSSQSCEEMDSSPSQSEGSDFRDDAEHLRTSETNGSISETPESSGLLNGSSQSTQIMLELQHDGRSAEAVELQHDPTSCSPANGHPSEIVQEQGTCTEEIAETQLCESNCFSRQKLQQTKSPSKQSGSSVDQDERPTRTNPPTCSRLLNDTADSPTWERCAMPSGLAQVELSPCVSQAQSLEVNTALVHGWSVDDTSSMSSDDDLMDEVFAPCGEIMCEIRDVGRSCRSSAPDEVGPSGEAIDLLKAYEQDAIVLDVIQDDPELFGDVPEVPNVVPVMKSGIPSVSTFIHPMKMYTMKNNQKIIWDTAKLSATGRDNLGQQDDKKGVGRILLPVQIDGERPILNGQVGEGVHTESSVPAQSTAESAQSSEWLWPDFATSVQGNARLNSATAGAFTTDAGLDGDPMQTLVTNDLCAQSAVWTARSFSNQGEGSEKYCRYYFSEQHICFRKSCWYRHLPAEGDEKFCMAAVRRLCSGQPCHLHRAATVFTEYYQQCAPGVHFETHTLKSLLSALFSQGIVKDVLSVLRVMTYHQILPPVEFILSLFERVSVWGLQIAVSDLIDLTGKCVEAGLVLTTENFEYMQHRLELLQATSSQMEVFMTVKYRALETAVTWKPEVGHLPIALAEVECCKEQQDWSKLGALFSSMCTSKASLAELNHLSGSIAMALLMDTPLTSPFPFCQFLEAVCQGASLGGLVKSLLGRIGVSLMLRYYKTQQWTKGKKLLDALNALKVNYSTFKGLIAGESSVSRCRIISMAAEVFLSCGSMENALRVLKDNEWILRSLLWQCEEADIAHRQSVLCRLAECTTQKNMFTETLEILTNLPDLADVPDGTDAVDPSQYSIFHWHLKACLEKQNLIVGSNIVEVMFTKKIEVDVCLLRSLVHKLGKQNSWQKARSLYKSALSVGCYPQTQMNKYCRILPVPHSLSEIEMTLALEMFMVSNASDIQNPGFFPHALQIVLKGKGGTELVSETDHHAAISRLLSAAQTANPKLVIKYATVSVNKEQVFTLDSLSAYKWLSQNLNWASKVWLSSDSKPETDFSPQALST